MKPPRTETDFRIVARGERARDPNQITMADARWLTNLAAEEIQIDADWLAAANQWISKGSEDLRFDDRRHVEVVQARHNFFNQLGWDREDSPLHEAHLTQIKEKPTLIPLGTFINLQRRLYAEGVDNQQAIKNNHSLLWKSIESVAPKLAMLKAIGANVARVVTYQPTTLNQSAEVLAEKVRVLRRAGVDMERASQARPDIFIRSPHDLKHAIETSSAPQEEPVLKRAGSSERAAELLGLQHDKVRRIAQELPRILNYPEPRLLATGHLLAAQGSSKVTEFEIGQLISLPLELHFLCLLNNRPYTAAEVRAAAQGTDPQTRQQAILDAIRLRRHHLESVAGKKNPARGKQAVQAYEALLAFRQQEE